MLSPIATVGYHVQPPLEPYLNQWFSENRKPMPKHGWAASLASLAVYLIDISDADWLAFTEWVAVAHRKEIDRAMTLRLYTTKIGPSGYPHRYKTKQGDFLIIYVSPMRYRKDFTPSFLGAFGLRSLDVLQRRQPSIEQASTMPVQPKGSRFKPLPPLPPRPTLLIAK